MPRKANKPFVVVNRKSKKVMGRFLTRKDAVYWCKVNQSLPIPDYEWEDEFCIQKYVQEMQATKKRII